MIPDKAKLDNKLEYLSLKKKDLATEDCLDAKYACNGSVGSNSVLILFEIRKDESLEGQFSYLSHRSGKGL